MIRTQALLVATAMVFAASLGSATAQTGNNPNTKCGPEAWSTAKMMYVGVPCVGAESSGGGTIGAAAPTVAGSNSTTLTKQEMKGGYGPMQTQAVSAGPGYAAMGASCGASNAVAITDEYGHKYNCRGDRIR